MRTIAIVLVSFSLFACSSGDHEDLRNWINEESKSIKGKIAPLPEVKPYEPVAYNSGSLVDPFKSVKDDAEQKGGGGGKRPDLDRPREPLESYPLESMKYVGVFVKNKTGYAIIQTDGSLFQVRIGNHIGLNFGAITKISEAEIVLQELVQDATGDWVERTSTLLLQDKEGKK